jgi:hypothetical protein
MICKKYDTVNTQDHQESFQAQSPVNLLTMDHINELYPFYRARNALRGFINFINNIKRILIASLFLSFIV